MIGDRIEPFLEDHPPLASAKALTADAAPQRDVNCGVEVVMPLVYATPQAGERLSYAHTRPIAVPESLGELTGPATGAIELPLRLDWTPRRYYDLSKPSSVYSQYETVLRSAIDVDDVTAYINGDLLMAAWRKLRISGRIRTAWEQRFPGLANAH